MEARKAAVKAIEHAMREAEKAEDAAIESAEMAQRVMQLEDSGAADAEALRASAKTVHDVEVLMQKDEALMRKVRATEEVRHSWCGAHRTPIGRMGGHSSPALHNLAQSRSCVRRRSELVDMRSEKIKMIPTNYGSIYRRKIEGCARLFSNGSDAVDRPA